MNRKRPSRSMVMSGYGVLLCLVVLWELAAFRIDSATRLIPSPYDILGVFRNEGGLIMQEALHSLRRTVFAFSIGGAAGVVLGLCHGVFPVLRRATAIVIEGLRPLPSVALIPLAMLLVGMGDGLNLTVAAFACTWPVFISAYAGVQGINPLLIDSALTIGISKNRIFREVILPGAMPAMVTGLRIGLAIAFAVEISIEMVVPKHGIGALAVTAAFSGHNALLYAAITSAAMVGFVLNHTVRAIEHVILRQYGPQWSDAS